MKSCNKMGVGFKITTIDELPDFNVRAKNNCEKRKYRKILQIRKKCKSELSPESIRENIKKYLGMSQLEREARLLDNYFIKKGE